MFRPGEEQDVVVGARTYRLGRLTVRVLRAFRDAVAAAVGDPFADVERWLGKVPESESMRQLRAAEDLRDQLRFFSLGCPIATRYLNTEEGGAKLMTLLLREQDKTATEEDGLLVMMELARREQVPEALKKAQGDDGGAAPEGPPRPE